MSEKNEFKDIIKHSSVLPKDFSLQNEENMLKEWVEEKGFYTNCSSIEKAEEVIKELAKKGKKAVIGEPLSITGEKSNNVGVYIINEQVKDERVKDGESR